MVRRFDERHHPGACTERYCRAAMENIASASRYPMLGPRQAPSVITMDNEQFETRDLIEYVVIHCRR